MPIYEMTQEQRRAYKQFIKEVRTGMDMNQAEFAQVVIQYAGPDDNGKYTFHVHRNSVQSWESEKKDHVPLSQETFISIALLKVRKSLERTDQTPEERARCYTEVLDLYKRYMGMEMHEWYLPDAVMIEAIRGIYSMEEVPEVVDRLKTMIGRKGISADSVAAEPGPTNGIRSELEQVFSDEDLVKVIEKYSKQFTFGYGVVGRRMKKLFDERQKSILEEAPRLRTMIAVYAPRQRNSYQKTYEQVCSVSRSWLIDFCIHMRFSREDINQILHAARYMSLPEDNLDPEHCIRDYVDAPLGSAAWYLEEDVQRYYQDRNVFRRYEAAASCPPREKAAFLILLAEAVNSGIFRPRPRERNRPAGRYPIDYFLDYFPNTDSGKILLREIWSRLPAVNSMNKDSIMKGWIWRMEDILGEGLENTGPLNSAEQRLYNAYADEFENYYRMPVQKGSEFTRGEASELYLFAALAYSVCTGELWSGSFPPDLKLMNILEQVLPQGISYRKARMLLYNVMVLMLGPSKLEAYPGKRICFSGQTSKIFYSMKDVADALYKCFKSR